MPNPLLEQLRCHPRDAELHRQLADGFALKGKWVPAIAEYRTALTLAGERADLRERLAACMAAAASERPADSISHNLYFRTQWLAREIRARFPSGRFSILDAGGGDGRLALDLPDADYVLAEPATNGVLVTADLHFNRRFDCVVCCHVVEHIPVELRDAFLDVLCGMADQHVLLLNPVVDTHTDLRSWQQAIFDITGAKWAKEHIECEMPRLEDLTSYCDRRGYRHTEKANGSKALSLAMVFFDHYAKNGAPADVARINQMFNALALDDLDHAAWPNAWLIDIETGAASNTDVTQLAAARLSATIGDRETTVAPPLAPGAVLAERYEIQRLLGRGGMGEVYLATDRTLGLHMALKFLPATLAGDPQWLAQFHNEVRVARQVSHPNVCRVYDIGDDGGRLFLSMEYVDGEDLSAVLARDGRVDESRAIVLTQQLCAGLAAVHAAGVLHRDLKPANIMLDRSGQIRLMDFGLAGGGSDGISSSGTPGYMAPEQFSGAPASVATDIYALGLVMYEVFTGQRAYNARSLSELIQQHADHSIPRPTEVLPTLDASIERAILACLSPTPTSRPHSARDVSAMAQTVLLDASDSTTRILQQLVPALSMLAMGFGLPVMLAGYVRSGGIVAAAGAVMLLATQRLILGWSVAYKGHSIRFENHPFLGERLLIDGVVVAKGGVGLRKTLRGTIERGEGAGERITSESVAHPRRFSCRIVAERFGGID